MSFLSELPKFGDMISNVTVSVGREATFTCIVDDLGSYRVRTKYLFWIASLSANAFFVYFIPLDNFSRDKITPETEISPHTHGIREDFLPRREFSSCASADNLLVRGSTRSYRDTIAKCYYLSSDLMSFPPFAVWIKYTRNMGEVRRGFSQNSSFAQIYSSLHTPNKWFIIRLFLFCEYAGKSAQHYVLYLLRLHVCSALCSALVMFDLTEKNKRKFNLVFYYFNFSKIHSKHLQR